MTHKDLSAIIGPSAWRGQGDGPQERTPDLVVLSHLRWQWVWQRPQHLVSRIATARGRTGARTVFVEEPQAADVPAPELRLEPAGPVLRAVLLVPGDPTGAHLGFDHPVAYAYPSLLASVLRNRGMGLGPDAWLYTPMALPFLSALEPGLVVYDVMDDLANFAGAPAGLRERQRELLDAADVVFTGGRSLHSSVTALRPGGVHLFASGVETSHYATALVTRSAREEGGPRVAGYVGVIDERIDLQLVADLADQLPDWIIRMVGPVAKIEEDQLPRRPNLEYPGMVSYDELPDELARFDVALMPFALNDATARISPTKTLEYFAAGLRVVSTRVPDVVADYGDQVHLADDGPGFAAECRAAIALPGAEGSPAIQTLLRRREWDAIAAAMSGIVDARPHALAPASTATPGSAARARR